MLIVGPSNCMQYEDPAVSINYLLVSDSGKVGLASHAPYTQHYTKWHAEVRSVQITGDYYLFSSYFLKFYIVLAGVTC